MLGPDGYNIRQTFQPADNQHWVDTLDLPANRVQPVSLALSLTKGSLAPGLYYLRPGFNTPGSQQQQLPASGEQHPTDLQAKPIGRPGVGGRSTHGQTRSGGACSDL